MTNMAEVPTLTKTEWQAILIGLQDARSSRGGAALNPVSLKGRLQRIVNLLRGVEPPRPLADPRLEALRRFASARVARRTGNDPAPLLREQGFDQAQVDAIAQLADQLGRYLDMREPGSDRPAVGRFASAGLIDTWATTYRLALDFSQARSERRPDALQAKRT